MILDHVDLEMQPHPGTHPQGPWSLSQDLAARNDSSKVGWIIQMDPGSLNIPSTTNPPVISSPPTDLHRGLLPRTPRVARPAPCGRDGLRLGAGRGGAALGAAPGTAGDTTGWLGEDAKNERRKEE